MKRFNISHEYDCDLSSKSVYSADTKTLSQICSFLNPIRKKAEQTLGAESEIKLSSAYVLYYYLLDLSESILVYSEKESEEKAVEYLDYCFLRIFTFDDFKKIVNAHGLVPVSAMPDAAHHHKSDCVYLLENRLHLAVKQLGDKSEKREKTEDDIRRILSEGLGELPESFSFSYIADGDRLVTLNGMTPQTFFTDYCKHNPEEYKEVKTREGIKAAVSMQIKDGEQVVILADTRHQSNKMLGILDTDFLDNTDVFGADYSLTKEEKIRLGIIKPTAYLSLDGVAFGENGEVLRFKAQDTDGSETGADGHYTMSGKWFDEYVLSAIVNKKYLS